MKHLLASSLFFLAQHLAFAQHSETKTAEHQGMKGSHRLTLGLGHTHTSQGEVDGETQWLALPSWSLNYDYWLSDQWAIGLQNDLILESFIIVHGDDEELERTKPLAVVPIVLFKPGTHFTLLGGVGVEFAHEKNLTLTRLGAEYGWHLPKDWEVGAAVVWDGKWGYYNSWDWLLPSVKSFLKNIISCKTQNSTNWACRPSANSWEGGIF